MATNLTSLFRFLFKRHETERELDAELLYHVDRLTEQNIAKGMSAGDARRQALLLVGGVEPAKEECRDARRGRIVEAFLQDVRHGVRVLLKNPGFAAAAILTLALGIGANTAIFSVVYGVLLRPLPYARGGQLVVLHQTEAKAHIDDMAFSVKEIDDYRHQSHTLEAVVEHHSMNFLLMGRDSAERVETAVVSANFFDVLGVKPLLGRTFVDSDDTPGSNAVLILSHKYWQTRQNGDRNIVGRVFQMNNRPHTVIGVLPPIPQYPVESDVYMPTSQCPTRSSAGFKANRRARMMTAFARLKPGVTVAQAQSDVAVVASQMERANPEAYPKQNGYTLAMAPLQDDLTRRARAMFLVLLGVSGFVLLIACANVANLLLARLLKLERELSVRAALGASRGRLVRQVLTESVVLSVCGGLVGLALAPAALDLLVKFAGRFTERAAEVRMDAPVLLFTFAISVLTGIVFGLVPSLFSSAWLGGSVRQGGNWSTMSRGRHHLRAALVIAQVAVSVVLLAGAGLMIRSFVKLQQVRPGFTPDRLLTMRLSPPFPAYNRTNLRQLTDRVLSKMTTVPGVEASAMASSFPFNPIGLQNGPSANNYEIEGQARSKDEVKPTVDIRIVTAAYFDTIRQPIVKGRSFTEHDQRDGATPALVINETMARHRFPDENPIGKRLRFDQGTEWGPWNEIVGVAKDVKEYGLEQPVVDEIYGAYQNGFVNRLIVRTTLDPTNTREAMRAALHEIDPMVAIDRVDTVEHAEYDSMASPRVMTLLLAIFAGLAVVISASGIGAVMALTVNQRTRELGVRMALGARAGSIVMMVLRQGLMLALAGTVLGTVGAVVFTRLLSSFLYGTSATDLFTFIAVPVLFLLVAAVACFIPARAVTSIDPLVALRQE